MTDLAMELYLHYCEQWSLMHEKSHVDWERLNDVAHCLVDIHDLLCDSGDPLLLQASPFKTEICGCDAPLA